MNAGPPIKQRRVRFHWCNILGAGGVMDNILRYRSLEAFCRQRARIEGQSCDVWLEKASIFARLAAAESRSKKAETNDEEKSSRAD
jgi:hypothetical protein